MKKKILIIMMLAALIALPVYAAGSDQAQTQSGCFGQMMNYHQQMMQQAVDNGTITQEQAEQMNQYMQQMGPNMMNQMKDGMMNGSMGQNNGGMGSFCTQGSTQK